MTVGQTEFTQALLDPTIAAPDGLNDPAGRPAGKRFDVYRNNVVLSLTEALITAFPAIHRHLGDERFRAMAGIYIRRHPPSTPMMMFYGAQMPEFLRGFKPLSKLGFLPDLARLDLARRQSYHAADARPIRPDALQDVPPDALMQARFTLAPALRLIQSEWPVCTLWRQAMEDQSLKAASQAEPVLICRPEYDPVMTQIDSGGAAFVAALIAGKSFGQAFDKGNAAQDGFDLSPTLGALLSGGGLTEMIRGHEE